MLTQVEVRNSQGQVLVLPLQDVSDGFIVKDIEGLDPVKATIASSSFALMDGSRYQSSHREARNLVLKLGYSSNYISGSVEDLRKRLYGFFMPKSSANFSFIGSEQETVSIAGRIESFDNPLFAKEPEVAISVLCFDPDFYALESLVVSGNTVADESEMLIDYLGTTETGIIFKMSVDRVLPEFTIYETYPDGSLKAFAFAAPLIAGDVVEINMVAGFKGAKLIRAGVASSILYGIAPFASWLKLYPGESGIRVYAEGAPVPYTIEYITKFGGL